MNKLPLYKQIQEVIRTKIIAGELRPKDRVPSEQEMMEEFKVSKITVKNALTALADEGLVIRVQGKGTFVSPRPVSNTVIDNSETAVDAGNFIGLIIPTMKTQVIQQLVDHIEYFLKEAGYQLALHITRESSQEETRAIRYLTQSSEVKGLIVFPTEDETYNESLLRLSLDKFPFVFIDRYLRNIDTYRVTADNFGGSYKTVSNLLEKGHRQIALISPDNTNTTIEDRTLGFERACIEHGILIDKSLWCHVPITVLRSGETLAYIEDFLRKHPNITAVFTLSAEMASLTYHALQQISGSRPEMTLISFDDPGIPNIPYIRQNEKQMAKSAVELLLSQLDGEYYPQKIEIPVNLNFIVPELL
jgi:DNA-binding LacI/PurR family transcriptional regulator